MEVLALKREAPNKLSMEMLAPKRELPIANAKMHRFQNGTGERRRQDFNVKHSS